MVREIGSQSKVNFLIIGAGAIGLYIGGSLIQAGHSVVFLNRPNRPEHTEEITVNLQDHSFSTPGNFKSSLSDSIQNNHFDSAILAVKSYDTEDVLSEIAPFAKVFPPILCLQNGIENEEKIASVIGKEKIIPATLTSAVGKPNKYESTLEKLRGVGISSRHPLSKQIFQAFLQAKLNPQLIEDATAMKWSKMLTNLIGNATSAILGLPPKEVFSNNEIFHLEILQLKETLQVMHAIPTRVINLPGTPINPLMNIVQHFPEWISKPLFVKVVAGGRGDKMPSFYIDLHSNNSRSEVNFLNGAVVRYGQKLQIATPANKFLTHTLENMIAKSISIDTYKSNPHQLYKDFAKFNS